MYKNELYKFVNGLSRVYEIIYLKIRSQKILSKQYHIVARRNQSMQNEQTLKLLFIPVDEGS